MDCVEQLELHCPSLFFLMSVGRIHFIVLKCLLATLTQFTIIYCIAERYTSSDDVSEEIRVEYTTYAAQLFGMIGGVAFLTLMINGPTSGFLLKKLGLITPSETRNKYIEGCREHMVQFTLKEFVALLSEERFHDVDFTVVKVHIPFLGK